VRFYVSKLSRLLEYEPMASAKLDQIDESLIESYVQRRRKLVSPASVNRELATLRRLLRLGQEWQEIGRVPRIRLLAGEHCSEFVLGHSDELVYLNEAPEALRAVATLMLDTGLRIGEALTLTWADVRLEPASGASFGYLRVRAGKSKNARRNVPLTERV